jgi:WD40 repeat protein
MDARLRADRDWINAFAPLSDGRVASASDDVTICIWNPLNGCLEARHEGHRAGVNALAVLRDGWLVSDPKTE